MRTYQSVTLLGRVGSEPTHATTQAGNDVAGLSVATDRTDGDGQKHPVWHRVTAWGELAKLVVKYVSTGDAVHVVGEIRYGSYDRDGVSIPTAEIVAREISFIGKAGPGRDGAR